MEFTRPMDRDLDSARKADEQREVKCSRLMDLLGIVVKPLDLHRVNVGSIPTGPTHGEEHLQPHPGDVLKSTPNVR